MPKLWPLMGTAWQPRKMHFSPVQSHKALRRETLPLPGRVPLVYLIGESSYPVC